MKKILAFILIVVILAAIGFAAYMLFFKADNTPQADDTPDISDNSQPSNPILGTEPSESENPIQSPDTTQKPVEMPITSNRDAKTVLKFSSGETEEQFEAELFVSDFGTPEYGVAYSIYIDNAFFAKSRDNDTDVFESETGFKLEISLHRNTTGEALSPSFMDSYINFTDIEFEGNSVIGATGLRGFTINASGEGNNSRAYLINYEGDVIAVVITYDDNASPCNIARVQTMIDTLCPEV